MRDPTSFKGYGHKTYFKVSKCVCNSVTYGIKHLYLSGFLLGVAPNKNTKKTCVFNIDMICLLKSMITLLRLVVDIIGGTCNDHLMSS